MNALRDLKVRDGVNTMSNSIALEKEAQDVYRKIIDADSKNQKFVYLHDSSLAIVKLLENNGFKIKVDNIMHLGIPPRYRLTCSWNNKLSYDKDNIDDQEERVNF